MPQCARICRAGRRTPGPHIPQGPSALSAQAPHAPPALQTTPRPPAHTPAPGRADEKCYRLIAALPPGIPLDIIGPRSDEAHLAALQRQARNKTVRFRHDCDDQVLIDAYRRALCVVLPSVYRAPGGRETLVPELLRRCSRRWRVGPR